MMLEVPVYTVEGRQVGQMAIDEEHLGGKVRPRLLKQALVMFQANRRQGSAATKSRGQVRGSTRKLYRQKGTGRARVGSARTSQRRGGGMAFAKTPRDFSKRMPKRMRRLANRNAVLVKILSEDALIFEQVALDQPKTGELRSALQAVGAGRGCVMALATPDDALRRSARNLPKIEVMPVGDLNAYDVLRRNKLIFTRAAFESLAERVAEEHSG